MVNKNKKTSKGCKTPGGISNFVGEYMDLKRTDMF
jgi:hypothetical protein